MLHAVPLAELFDDTIASDELLNYWSRILRARRDQVNQSGQFELFSSIAGRYQQSVGEHDVLPLPRCRLMLFTSPSTPLRMLRRIFF
jgi:hypothetical protein